MRAMKHKAGAPKPQRMPSTPPSRAESKTARPAKGRKIGTPAAPQPVPQNVKRKKGTMR